MKTSQGKVRAVWGSGPATLIAGAAVLISVAMKSMGKPGNPNKVCRLLNAMFFNSRGNPDARDYIPTDWAELWRYMHSSRYKQPAIIRGSGPASKGQYEFLPGDKDL